MTACWKSFANASALLVLLLLWATGARVSAQSTDPNVPTPIRGTNVLGKIAARDLGDSRLTDHYYTFRGTPGDLLITVNSRNLNGDVDVFTAATLRPLLKLTLYAESTSPVTKGIYLRKSEDLVLRVEARSPNDDEGTYQFVFGGSFQPIYGGEDIAQTEPVTTAATPTPSAARKTKRVSSVGATIEEPPEPVTEVAAAPTPEPAPEAKASESPAPPVVEKGAEPEPRKVTPTPRASRTRRPAGRRATTPAARPPVTTAEEVKKEEQPTAARKEEQPATEPAEPKPSTRSSARRGSSTARATKPPPEPVPETGPRLIIETNDGTLINRAMSNVRRVTVENGQVVVLNRDGTTNRILLANVVRMTIQP